MGITTITLNRENLVNKREAHYIEGEVLKIIGLRAYLKEAISYENGAYTAVHIFDGNGQELTEGTTGDYILNNEGATIDFNSQPTVSPYTATYYGVGSIIWADDVNELQDAVKQLNNAGLAKDGSVTMTGNLNLGTNNITNVGTVDGVDISTHDHSNGQGNLIPAEGLANNSVITSKILDGNVTTAKINDSAVTNDKIANGTIESGKLNALSILNMLYPIGSVYLTFSASATCPLSILGGTWEKLTDLFLVGAGNLYPLGGVGGEATHTLTHEEMPIHRHNVLGTDSHGDTWSELKYSKGIIGRNSGNQYYKELDVTSTNSFIENTGGGQAHNNLPPYKAVNMWRRTA